MKGQITLINFLAIVVTLIVYAVLLPVLNSIFAVTVAGLQADPGPYTVFLVALIYFTPFLLLLMIILSGLNMAIPRREAYGGPQ